MPEMPEVETMVGRLQKHVGKTIYMMSTIRCPARYLPGDYESKEPIMQKITGIYRRGKFMVFALERGAMLAHNAMSGYWDTKDEPWCFDYVEGARESSLTDIQVQIQLADPVSPLVTAQLLRFHDARKFGSLRYLTPEQLAEKLSSLGPEAVDSQHLYEPSAVITLPQFDEVMRGGRKKTVKEMLVLQDRIAGVGNIYACEALWKAHVRPTLPAVQLNDQETVDLFESVKSVMSAALDRGLNYDGLKIYRRSTCPDCSGPVSNEKIKGRSTYWCPKCQS